VWGLRRFGEQGVQLLAFSMVLGKGDTINFFLWYRVTSVGGHKMSQRVRDERLS
jgi:hypothetical protein